MYEPALRMPLLVRWPGVVEAGSTSDRIVLNLDFAPTLLEAAGLEPAPGMQGRSFVPLLAGQPCDNWRRSMLYRFYEEAFGIGPIEGVRTDRYKLVHWLYGDKAWELYDLQQDPEETRNRYGDAAFETVRAELHAELVRLKKDYRLDD
ncbi:MAG: sulfatase/phosphatase domain-containing protein [Thermoguttaceae bacterium]